MAVTRYLLRAGQDPGRHISCNVDHINPYHNSILGFLWFQPIAGMPRRLPSGVYRSLLEQRDEWLPPRSCADQIPYYLLFLNHKSEVSSSSSGGRTVSIRIQTIALIILMLNRKEKKKTISISFSSGKWTFFFCNNL